MKRIAIFFACLAVFAGIAWIGGYNFDTRNGWVAYYVLVSLVISAWLTYVAHIFRGDLK